MMTMSKPLSAGQAQRYHAEQFRDAGENYYTEGHEIRGQWDGRLAAAWGLAGEVSEEQFARLAEGQHPLTGEVLVKAQTPHLQTNARGETVRTVEHRAAWDLTLSAPKSVSLTALVGGDERVREAHRQAVDAALRATERYVQARLGGLRPAQTTGQWVAARFEHDSARPVDGYSAPQLHTHTVVFNMTTTEDGQTRALQPRELYRSQQYATAVYRSTLATQLRALGYEIDRGGSGQPEIRGYTPDVPRRLEPPASANRDVSRRDRAPRRRRRADRGASDARREGGRAPPRDAADSPRPRRGVQPSAGARRRWRHSPRRRRTHRR